MCYQSVSTINNTHCISKCVHNFLNPFISKGSRRAFSFFLSVQLLQPYVSTGHTSTFISRVFVEIGMLVYSVMCFEVTIDY